MSDFVADAKPIGVGLDRNKSIASADVSSYRPEIDGLRAIAVSTVVLYHAGLSFLPRGFVGVDVFFVISGYLITSILYREWLSTAKIDLTAFYARRVRRILPALWVVTTCTLIAAAFFLSPIGGEQQAVAKSAVAAMGFVANIYFHVATGDYFSPASGEMPLLHLWSLGVEEQFYFFWPLLLFGLLAYFARRTGAILAALAVASFLICEYTLKVSPSMAFYELPARFWEIAIGGVISLSSTGRQPLAWPKWVAIIGVLSILASASNVFQLEQFPGFGALPAVFGSALVLLGIQASSSIGLAGNVLSFAPMRFLGRISYSLYLWHWPLLAFDRMFSIERSSIAWSLALCSIATMLASASLVFIEIPARRAAHGLRSGVVVLIGVIGSSLVVAMAGGLGFLAKSAHVQQHPAYVAFNDRVPRRTECFFTFESDVNELPTNDCNTRPGVEPRVVIWGDSHAQAWSPFAWKLFDAPGHSVATYALQACPPAVGYSSLQFDQPGHLEQCKQFNRMVAARVDDGDIDVVVLSGRWMMYMLSLPESPVSAQARNSKRSLIEGLRKTLTTLSGKVGRIVILGPIPQLKRPASWCITRSQLDGCAWSRVEFESQAAETQAMLKALSSEFPNVEYVDPEPFFCGDSTCSVMRDGYSLYSDDDHITQSAARNFAIWYLQRNAEGASKANSDQRN